MCVSVLGKRTAKRPTDQTETPQLARMREQAERTDRQGRIPSDVELIRFIYTSSVLAFLGPTPGERSPCANRFGEVYILWSVSFAGGPVPVGPVRRAES